MSDCTLHELRCFDAVVRDGGFRAAAERLGLTLLDRSGYRVQLTGAGRALHRKVRFLRHEAEELATYAAQLAVGEEAELRGVLGDLCPLPPVLELLSRFFAPRPQTRLHLEFEAVAGLCERLREDGADVIVHRVP